MKHRILALFLSVALLFSAAPAAFAAYTPEEQLDILLELSELIRTEGLESSPSSRTAKWVEPESNQQSRVSVSFVKP